MEKKFERKIQTSGHRLNSSVLLGFMFLSVFAAGFDNVYGHGVGSETFPPVDLNGKLVTLEASSSSSKSDPNTNDDQQISISLIDFNSKITLRDVTFLIKAQRGEQFLFEQEFKADNGFIVFNFVSKDIGSIVIEEDTEGGGLFGSLLGLESRMIHVKGPKLSEGGLYKLDVVVLTADGYSQNLDVPLTFDVGISIAQTSIHNFIDPNFGKQNIHIITYYDEISNFNYDSDSKKISFSMPFDWSQSNINQTSVVHEEIIISKKFGDLLVSDFTMYVNGIQLSQNIVNIDDFAAEQRTVHFIIYQKELQNIFENTSDSNGMNFVIKPDRDYTHLSAVTDNGQFKIFVSPKPENLKSNSNAKIFFDVTDIFLKNKPVATDYEFSVTQNERIIFEQSGTSTDSKDEHSIAEFLIPDDLSGIVNFNFKNLDGNKLAKATFPVVINSVPDKILIPEWVRSNALKWSEEQIDDQIFIQGIEYLVKNNIIEIKQETLKSQEIPSWIRNNAKWWSEQQIDDQTFIQGLEFLIQKGIIRI